jgi:competence protein ComEA
MTNLVGPAQPASREGDHMSIAVLAALLCAAADPSAPELPPAPAAAVADVPPAESPGGAEVDATERAPPRAKKRKGKPPMAGVVNVNRASEAELRLLPGIGKKRAQLIVERREKKPFASLDEVGRLKGMRKLVHKLRGQLVVQGDTTLHPARP